ncbi:hypothetical protein [Aliarcobacter skirrowii]|uniref:hypothetical protein n=1 Tax=Aliarcobacter skirrowii TaxID=28200 RepID=UPI0008340FD5|nr:hypothetical protein [Aliarcobacter skirrowii]
MATKKSIIPEFMKDNPDDTFQFLFPLRMVIEEEKYGISHYEVVVKNITKDEVFEYQVSPELLFTHYQLLEYYQNLKNTLILFIGNDKADEFISEFSIVIFQIN